MKLIIQAISNHLTKHNITNHTSLNSIRIYHRGYTTVTHYSQDNIITIFTYYTPSTTYNHIALNPTDPELFPKILKTVQQVRQLINDYYHEHNTPSNIAATQ